MPIAKRRCLASIMGTMLEDEDKGEKSPDVKAPRMTPPKVVVPAGEVFGSKGEVEVEALKGPATSEDDRSAGSAHPVRSGDALAAATSEERPPEETLDERGEFL